jgi:chromatin assembly factor 1 subunit B
MEKFTIMQRFESHKNYVTGVTIDPFFKYIITQSTDKTIKVMKNTESKQSVKFYLKNNIYKRKCLLDEEEKVAVFDKDEEDEIFDSPALQKEKKLEVFSHRMFLDDSELFSFSRRLEFSPDGSFFIAPCGIYQVKSPKNDAYYVSYGFTRNNISEPAFVLPSSSSCPLAVKFHPALFERKEEDEPFIDLPYILVFAIATQDQIMVYSTRSLHPYSVISNIHYAEITDLSWSKEKLIASSRDGFVTHVVFEESDLGKIIKLEDIPEAFAIPNSTNGMNTLFDYLDIELWKARNKKEEVEQKVIQPTFKSRKNKVEQTS